MSVRRFRIPLALFASAIAAALSCGDPSPAGVSLLRPVLQKGGKDSSTSTSTTTSSKTGLVRCGQTYDSVTKLIGPRGDTLRVGPHIFWVDSLVLADTVRITAQGTGINPIVGADLVPLAGEVGGPPATQHEGIDFVHILKRS